MVLPSVATPDISGYLPAAIPEALSQVPAVQRGPDALSAGSGEEEDEEHLVLLGALAAVQSAGIWPNPNADLLGRLSIEYLRGESDRQNASANDLATSSIKCARIATRIFSWRESLFS